MQSVVQAFNASNINISVLTSFICQYPTVLFYLAIGNKKHLSL
jgi:hypothetical protein